jgi:hypothetical protein
MEEWIYKSCFLDLGTNWRMGGPQNQCAQYITIPTERPPLVGEVIANFSGLEGATW